MNTTPAAPTTHTYCGNEYHTRQVKAVARLSWPDGRFNPTTACATCLRWHTRDCIDEGHAVLVEPLAEHKSGAYVSYAVTRQVKEVARLHRCERGRDVRAILLQAPDHPQYEDLPETLAEREKLPARFHVPMWDGDGVPHAWLCAVCWEEGVTCQWPCKVASEQGGEVFAR